MATDVYDRLVSAEERIRNLLLPTRHDEQGEYTDEELIRVDAYIAFCHAEIETYLEQITLRVLHWTEHAAHEGVVDRCGAALITYYRPERDKVPSKKRSPDHDVIGALAIKCAKFHLDAVGHNNGIKEDSFCAMFLPVGFDFRDVDPLLVGELEALGAVRGKLAHLSYGDHRRREITDPTTAAAKLSTLLKLLEALDGNIEQQFQHRLKPVPA